jgi:hypothetical protein
MANRQIRTWELERYLLGELPPSRMEQITRLSQENPEIKKEIDDLERANAKMLKQHPPESMLPEILNHYEENRRRAQSREKARPITLRRLLYAAPVLVSAFILLFIVFYNDGAHPDFTRIKGEESLDFSKTQIVIYRKTESGFELLKNGDPANAGDLLQIAYIPAGKAFGVILSIDGNGVATLHYPESKSATSLLKQGKKNLLPSAYELDDAPEFERFFFITAMKEIQVQSVINKAEELAFNSTSEKTANLELPDSYSQFSILLKKENKK